MRGSPKPIPLILEGKPRLKRHEASTAHILNCYRAVHRTRSGVLQVYIAPWLFERIGTGIPRNLQKDLYGQGAAFTRYCLPTNLCEILTLQIPIIRMHDTIQPGFLSHFYQSQTRPRAQAILALKQEQTSVLCSILKLCSESKGQANKQLPAISRRKLRFRQLESVSKTNWKSMAYVHQCYHLERILAVSMWTSWASSASGLTRLLSAGLSSRHS